MEWLLPRMQCRVGTWCNGTYKRDMMWVLCVYIAVYRKKATWTVHYWVGATRETSGLFRVWRYLLFFDFRYWPPHASQQGRCIWKETFITQHLRKNRPLVTSAYSGFLVDTPGTSTRNFLRCSKPDCEVFAKNPRQREIRFFWEVSSSHSCVGTCPVVTHESASQPSWSVLFFSIVLRFSIGENKTTEQLQQQKTGPKVLPIQSSGLVPRRSKTFQEERAGSGFLSLFLRALLGCTMSHGAFLAQYTQTCNVSKGMER